MNEMIEQGMPSSERARYRARYGEWAVVTGASDGIGRAIARRLAASGMKVLLVARRAEVLEALASELEKVGGTTRVLAADLGDPAGIEKVIEASRDLDVGLLVASAGFGTSGPFLSGSLDAELGMIDVNCRAVAALVHPFGKRFTAQRRGGIVLLSSLVGFQGVPGSANYAATKAYVQSLAEGLYYELRPSGVDVLASAPGPVHSGFASRAGMTMGNALTPEVVADATLRALGRQHTVWPGWLTKVLLGSLALLPRWGRVLVLRQVMAGMARRS